MIQRIQSIWLVVALVLQLSLFYFPLYTAYSLKPDQPIKAVVLKVHQYETISDSKEQKSESSIKPLPLILNFIVSLLILVCIFWYKNRPRQYQLSRFLILLDLGLLSWLVFAIENIKNSMASQVMASTYQIYLSFPVICIILFFIAGRAIMKDEEKVRASNRIR